MEGVDFTCQAANSIEEGPVPFTISMNVAFNSVTD
jgi:hypothetical protein